MVEGGANTFGGGAIDTVVKVVNVEADEVSNEEMIFEVALVGGAAVAAARRAASHGL